MSQKIIVQKLDEGQSRRKFVVDKHEQLTLILIGIKSVEYDVEVKLTHEGASADILGIIIGNEAESISLHTLQDHQAPQTTSNLLIKSVLDGRSQFNYEGFIRVQKKAQRTDAYQRNENLMLSGEAKAESKPALEILANDVRCTHSATVGKVDKEQLFYLESRGITKKSAQRLIVSGFLNSVFENIPNTKIKEQLFLETEAMLNSYV